MRIGELAKLAGVSADALRFYEKCGLIRSVRSPNGYRHYPDGVLELVRYITTAKRLGFTLAEIGNRIPELQTHPDPARALAEVFDDKARMIDARIAELRQLRDELLARANSACPLLPERNALQIEDLPLECAPPSPGV